jgi:hypothetical protein
VKSIIALDVAELAQRQARQRSIGPLENVNDRELVRTLIDVGMPAHAALAVYTNGQLRFKALQVWADVQNAAEGDPEAKARLDLIRERFVRMRGDELIHDDPNRFA